MENDEPQSSDQGELAIEVSELTKTYNGLKALDQLSFRVAPGVICGFVGPNGSGKTTTMRILATLLGQDGGVAKVFGMDTRSRALARKVRHNIGFMPDYFGLYTDMTAGEYLDFFAAAYQVPLAKRPDLVTDILNIVGLPDKKDTIISGLSRGMQQRLSLGRCLVHSPGLLLLDEPASGLDPRARIELMELLRELRNMGKTIFISSHILSELHNLCDTVVILEKGKLIYAGTLENASAEMREGRQFLELTIDSADDAEVDKALALLQDLDGVFEVRRQGNHLFLEYGVAAASADIIEACVKNQVRLGEARKSEARLEEIFMNLTAEE